MMENKTVTDEATGEARQEREAEIRIVARQLCRSRKWETGEDTCTLVCLDAMSNNHDHCVHDATIHHLLASDIVDALAKARTPPPPDEPA